MELPGRTTNLKMEYVSRIALIAIGALDDNLFHASIKHIPIQTIFKKALLDAELLGF